MQLSAHQAHAARWVTLQTVWVRIAHLLTPCSLPSAVDCEAMDVLVLRTALTPARCCARPLSPPYWRGILPTAGAARVAGEVSRILRMLRGKQWVEDFH